MDVYLQVRFLFYVRLQVPHLEVVVHPIGHKVWEPLVLPRPLKQRAEQLQRLLSEVISEDLERHKSLVKVESLCEERQSKVVDVVVGQVEMHEALVDSERLCESLCSVVRTLVVC